MLSGFASLLLGFEGCRLALASRIQYPIAPRRTQFTAFCCYLLSACACLLCDCVAEATLLCDAFDEDELGHGASGTSGVREAIGAVLADDWVREQATELGDEI